MRGFRGTRANMAMGARRVLGGVKHGIKFLGRANNFARQLGVNNPTFNNAVSNLEKYGLPTADFFESELPSQ
jgi:hypothetical protein